MNRMDRLFAILLLLQRHRRMRAVDLSERFEVSERTIYRDMRALIEIGIPLVSLPGEGYELLDTFHLSPVVLSSDEATALSLAARLLIHNSIGSIAIHAETALEKVLAVLPPDVQTQLHQLSSIIEVFPTGQPVDWNAPFLMQVLQAIDACQTLHIHYRGYREQDITERDVDPYQITIADGNWYVHCYCHRRRDIRNFRLSRIETLTVTDHRFEKRQMVPEKKERLTVQVQFDERILPHVRERQHYAFTGESEDGIMRYDVHTLTEIQYWILGFGSDARVIAPESLRTWLREEAQRLIQQLT